MQGYDTIAGPLTPQVMLTKFMALLREQPNRRVIDMLCGRKSMQDTSQVRQGLGTPPPMKEYEGEAQFQNLSEQELLIKTKKYQTGVEYESDLPIHRIWPEVSQSLAGLAMRATQHEMILLSGTVTGSKLGWDGVTFFNNTHPLKNSKENDNIVTGTGTAIDKLGDDIPVARKQLENMLDDHGEPLYQVGEDSKFLIQCPSHLYWDFRTLQNASLITSGNTNVFVQLFELWTDLKLTGNSWYMYLIDGITKPFSFDEYKPTEIKTWDVNETRMTRISAFRNYSINPWDYTKAVKVTNA